MIFPKNNSLNNAHNNNTNRGQSLSFPVPFTRVFLVLSFVDARNKGRTRLALSAFIIADCSAVCLAYQKCTTSGTSNFSTKLKNHLRRKFLLTEFQKKQRDEDFKAAITELCPWYLVRLAKIRFYSLLCQKIQYFYNPISPRDSCRN